MSESDKEHIVLADAINRIKRQIDNANATYAQITEDGQIIFHYEDHPKDKLR